MSDDNLLWNLTVDDTSPLLLFWPYSDGINITNGWSQWFSGSGPGTGYLATIGESGAEGSASMHVTSLPDASVQLANFFGTTVYVYGTSNCSYVTTLDGKNTTSAPSPGPLLFSSTGLASGLHTLTLTAKPTATAQQLALDGVVVTSALNSSMGFPNPVVYDNSDTSVLHYNGNWTSEFDYNVPNSTDPKPYEETKGAGASVTMSFTNAVAVGINGSTNYGNWVYTTTLNGKQTTLNGSTWWKIPNALLYYEGNLDPVTTYNITLTNAAADMNLKLNSFTVFQLGDSNSSSSSGATSTAGASPSSSASNPGIATASTSKRAATIAGAVVGTVVAVALFGLALFWFLRRRRMNRMQWDAVPLPLSEVPADGAAVINEVTPSVGTGVVNKRPSPTSPVYSTSSPSTATLRNSKSGLLRGTSSTVADVQTPIPPPPMSSNPPTSPATTSDPDRSAVRPAEIPREEDPLTTDEGINRIIQLVAQRIDNQRHDDTASPPAYQDFGSTSS